MKRESLNRGFAFFYALLILLVGCGGLVPTWLDEEGLLWGIFRVNIPLNLLHIGLGMWGVMCAFTNRTTRRFYFQITGSIFALLTIFGFVYDTTNIFGHIASNPSNTWFHLILGIIGLFDGFGPNKEAV